MRKTRKLFNLFFCLLMSIGFAVAQTTQVTGTVISAEDGEPVMGASIMVMGTTIGTQTDFNGAFTLNNVPTNATTIRISYIGLQTQEVAIKPRLNIILQPDTKLLDEVVVVGYNNQSQRSLASSVTVVKAESLKDIPSPSLDQVLQGKAAGVSITNPSAGVGQPPVVIIRGVSTVNSGTKPLYVVDGIPMTSGDIANMGNANALSDINTADIESMTILKDAAATAIYGSRAANGVVLITTKKGKQGAVKINYDMNIGYSVPTNFYKVMNAKEYVDFKTMAVNNVNEYRRSITPEGEKPNLLTATFGLWNLNHEMTDGKSGSYIDTNWGDQVLKNGTVENHSLSISSATDKSDYYISINHARQGGIVIGDAYERSGIRANGSVQPMKYLKIGMSSNYSYGHTHYTDAARNGSYLAAAGFPRVSLVLPPNLPVRNLDGTPYFEESNAVGRGPNSVPTTNYSNPVALYELGNGIDTWVNRIIASAYAELTPVDGLKFKSQFGIDFAQIEDKRQWNPFHGDGGGNNNGLANGYNTKESLWTWTNTVSYNTTIDGKHTIGIIAGMESSRNNYGYWTLQGSGSSDFSFMGIESDFGTYQGGGDIQERTMISYLANLNYGFQNTYLLSANFRRDGYSPLGVNERWGNFWGVAAAWRLSEEAFFNEMKATVDDLKLKASYGVVGNTDIGWYPAKSYYSSNYYGGAGSIIMTRIGDENLRWESSSTFNAGFEASLFNRLTIQAEWYKKKSIDLILDIAQAPSTGIYNSSLTTNAGKLQNTGVELTLSADVVKGKDFSWNTSFNIAFNKNEVLELPDDLPHSDDAATYNNISVVGKSLGQLYLYPTGGIDPESGRRIFYGQQGEKVYHDFYNGTSSRWLLDDGTAFGSSIERVICGNTLPTYFGGWSNTFLFKRFDLNLFLQYSGGNHIFNGTKATVSDMRWWNNSKDVMNNYWTEDNRNAPYAKPYFMDNVSNGSLYSMSDYVEKGDYLRVKNLSLGYSFNAKNWGKSIDLNISSLRVFVQAQNLFTFTPYTGLDPETITNVVDPILTGGMDKNTLPQARSYTFGLNISF